MVLGCHFRCKGLWFRVQGLGLLTETHPEEDFSGKGSRP